jgi:AraC-like DNA-binding protein
MSHPVLKPEDPALPITYPGFVFRVLLSEGHEGAALLSGTGLDPAHLVDPNFRCGFAPLRLLLLNAIEQTGDPHLGIRLAKRFEPTYIGLPAYAAMNAASFSDALTVLKRFFFLAFPAVEFDFDDGQSDQAGEIAVCLRPKFPFDGIEYFARISALIACDGLLNSILRTDRVVVRAETVTEEPLGWSTVADQIEFPVRFGADADRLIFSAEQLHRPLPAHDPVNHTRLTALCEAFAREAVIQARAVGQVLAYLEREKTLAASLSEVAQALGYSERSLRRQLERAGTSYRKLIDQARAQRARVLLGSTDQPIQTIAFDLGFDTASNFARSFKRWTGVTPKAFRDGYKAPPEAGRN